MLGADLLADQHVYLDLDVDRLDDQAVISDALEFEAFQGDSGWVFSLTLRPSSAGQVWFARC